MEKVEIGIYFCVTADVLKKSFTEMFLEKSFTNHMNFVQSLILIGCHGNRKAKFFKKILKNLLLRIHKGHEAETLHKCS